MPEKSIKLKVQEAMQDDVNKGIVRIDSALMRELDIRPGNIVEIQGGRTTVAIADRSLPGDIGLSIIRMDGLIRRNAKTSISEMVSIGKADVKEAKKVVIAPARKGIMIRANPIIFKQGLLGRAVVKGDIVSLGGTRRRRTAMVDNPFFEDMFSMLDDTMMGFGLGDLKFVVVDTLPKQAVLITENTQVDFKAEAVEVVEEKAIDISYEDVGGLEEEIKKIREMVELPLKHPEIFERLGIEAPKGVLLHGPPGTGKTLIAKAVANETNSNFFVINGPEIMSKFYGQSEENLRKKFEEAEKSAPSIVFIDEIDAIASKREESKGEVERRVVAQLLALMDGLKSRGKVVVIAATNIPNSLDPALRRPGRFDREIEIGVPSKEGRLNILKIHTRNMPLFDLNMALSEAKDIPKDVKDAITAVIDAENDKANLTPDSFEKRAQKAIKEKPELKNADIGKLKKCFKDVSIDSRIVRLTDIAQITHGFVGADLAALARESAMIVLRRVLPDLKLHEEEALPPELLEKLYLTERDFFDALKVVRPSALREVLIEVPNVHWDDIGGLDIVKQQLKEAVEWPLKHPEIFTRMGIRPPRGILLYGAPGTGKTLLAKAVAKETEANFISVKGPELLSKWVGESEKAVREIFKKARQASPAIIFFDEVDSIAPRRGQSDDSHVTERVVNQLLTEMDGLQMLNDIVIIAATNRPDILDTALLRPGRFDRILLTPVPDLETRKSIFRIHLKNVPLEEGSVPLIGAGAKAEAKTEAKKTRGRKPKKKATFETPAETRLPQEILSREGFIHELAKRTEGYVGADIEAICREAAIIALRDSDLKASKVSMDNFEKALDIVRPSASKDIEKAYADLESQFRSARAKEMEAEKPSYYG